MYRFCCLILCLFSVLGVYSAEKSHTLKEVAVEGDRVDGSPNVYSTVGGWNVTRYVYEETESKTLSDLLGKLTPLFVKEAGNGMTATISLRGASPSHTNVNWEGVRINSKTMGQTDFNQLPAFFFEDVVVSPGASSAVFGNGSIGGTVSLSNGSCFSDTFSLQSHSSYGSSNTFFEGLKLVMGERYVHSHTAFFYRRSDNDFKFEYKGEDFNQKNASFKEFGIVEDLSIRLDADKVLTGHFWLTNYDRRIQPMLQLNDDSSKYEGIFNKSSRILVEYANYTPFCWRIKSGWMNDRQEYEEELIKTTEWLLLPSVERRWILKNSLRINAKLGYEMSAVIPEVHAYLEDKTEWHHSVYLLSNFEFLNRWRLTANVRKSFVTDVDVPIAPSGGVFFDVVKDSANRFTIGLAGSRNVNVPTLNDKYWGKMGSTDLRVEKGLNLEVNAKYMLKLKRYEIDAQSSFFRNNVTDWILWLPRGNVWKPTNVDKVVAMGADVRVEQIARLGRSSSLLMLLGYAYNRTEVEEGFAEMKAFEGNQIAFLPQHVFSASLSGQFGGFHCSVTSKWVGERHATDIFDVLDPYFLLSGSVDYEWIARLKKKPIGLKFDIGVQVNNITGERYEVMPYRAMPLQNFLVFLKIKLNRKKDGKSDSGEDGDFSTE